MLKNVPLKLRAAGYPAVLGLWIVAGHAVADTLLPDQKIRISANAGTRWLSIKQEAVQAGEYGLRSLISLPRLPLGAGLALQYLRFRHRDYQKLLGLKSLREATGYSVSLDIRWYASSFLSGYLTPWVHYSHEVFSDYSFQGKEDTGQDLKVKSGTEGYRFSLGVDIRVSDTVACFTEFSMGLQNIRNNYHSETERPGDKYAFDSRAGLAGIEVTF